MSRHAWEDEDDIESTINRLRYGRLKGLRIQTTNDTKNDVVYASFRRPGIFSGLPRGTVIARRSRLSIHSIGEDEDLLVIDAIEEGLVNGDLVVLGSTGHSRYLHTMQQRRHAALEHKDALRDLAKRIDTVFEDRRDLAHLLSEAVAEALPTMDRGSIERLTEQSSEILTALATRLRTTTPPVQAWDLIDALDLVAPSDSTRAPGAA